MRAETKWTQGPWDAHVMTREVSVEAPCGRILFAVSRGSDEQVEHDAHLIAAAPELYEALASIVELGHSDTAMREARAALAKALGEA